MRVACVNQDAGIRPERKKGAAIHLRAMRRAFEALGAEVLAFDEPDGERLAATLAQAGPLDLVYERYSLGSAAAAEHAGASGVPFVLEMNTPLLEEEARWRTGEVGADVRAAEEKVLAAADHVIAVSNEVRDYALGRGLAPAAVTVHPNGVDTDAFRPRAHDDELRARLVPEGRFALGFHGRLRGWHGFDRLVRVARELLADDLPIHLVLVGEGDFDAELGDLDRAHVTRVGWVDHDEVPRYVATFDALPLTYPPDAPCYFSPLKLAEAMAAGVVPVVPDLGDLAEVVEDGTSGVIYDPNDLSAARKALAGLVAEPERRASLATGAVRRAADYSWRAIASFVLELPRRRRPA